MIRLSGLGKEAPGTTLRRLEHPVLDEYCGGSAWIERKEPVGLVTYRYYAGLLLDIDHHGTSAIPTGDPNIEPWEYEFQIMPLCQLRGARLSSVWGLEGKPGFTVDRESKATRLLIRVLQQKAGKALAMGGTNLPMLEVRSIRIGELEGKQMYGFTILGCSESLLIRINAAEQVLAESDLTLCTMDDYRERMVAMRLAGNQEMDAQEALTSGRKFMLWNTPRALDDDKLRTVATEYFGEALVESRITASNRMHLYGWIILKNASEEMQQRAADFEVVLQSMFPGVALALSKSREQRIRVRSAQHEQMEQKEALSRPPGQLKEIYVPAKYIQDAIMEPAFLEMWVDAIYERLGQRLVTDIVASIEGRVEQLIAARVEEATNKRLDQFEKDILAKVYRTIDSSLDVCLSRNLEAYVLSLANPSSELEQMIASTQIPSTNGEFGDPNSEHFGQGGKQPPTVTEAGQTTAAAQPATTQPNTPSIGTPLNSTAGTKSDSFQSGLFTGRSLEMTPSPPGPPRQPPMTSTHQTAAASVERFRNLDEPQVQISNRMEDDNAAGSKRPIEDTLTEETIAMALPAILTECTNQRARGAAATALDQVIGQALSSTPEQPRGLRQYTGAMPPSATVSGGVENSAPTSAGTAQATVDTSLGAPPGATAEQ
jgi:hypothetical protein